eukprot:TRINITY_DN57_c0_g1_i1.p1 TRINITY_DN57_c0_g1~~TRINITY_DN57_c0_g1_i1.p1  ORF type:complete len:203 (-),score=16.60 TRINITY_DN57_c0_g1_i1:42-650(-)
MHAWMPPNSRTLLAARSCAASLLPRDARRVSGHHQQPQLHNHCHRVCHHPQLACAHRKQLLTSAAARLSFVLLRNLAPQHSNYCSLSLPPRNTRHVNLCLTHTRFQSKLTAACASYFTHHASTLISNARITSRGAAPKPLCALHFQLQSHTHTHTYTHRRCMYPKCALHSPCIAPDASAATSLLPLARFVCSSPPSPTLTAP